MSILKKATLADKVGKNFVKIALKRYSVKVPSIKIGKIKPKKQMQSDKIAVSALVNILIRNALEKVKREKEKKPAVGDGKYKLLKEGNFHVQGGYGAVSRSYPSLIHTPYVDYGKLFSYLGKFKAKGAYQSLNGSNSQNNGGNGFALASSETMDKATRHIKYLRPTGREFGVGAGGIDSISLVPMGGMDSSEWEEFKLWFQLDKVAYYLKRKMA